MKLCFWASLITACQQMMIYPRQIISRRHLALPLSFQFFRMVVVSPMRAVFEPHLALPAHCLLMTILSLIKQINCFVAALLMQW